MAPVVSYDASYVGPHAFVLERSAEGRAERDLGNFAELMRHRVLTAELTIRLADASTQCREIALDATRTQAELRKELLKEKKTTQALLVWRDELEMQAQQMELDAIAERSNVDELASLAALLLDPVHKAEVRLAVIEDQLSALVRDGINAPSHRQSRLAGLWRRSKATPLRSPMEVILKAVESAQHNRIHHLEALTAAKQAEQLALAREPRASQLESAAVVTRSHANRATEVIGGIIPDKMSLDCGRDDYTKWVELYDTLKDHDRLAIRARISSFIYKPLISVVVPVYNTSIFHLRAAIGSVQAQLYENWELCIADDASTDPAIPLFLKQISENEPRVKSIRRNKNGHISAATNSALNVAAGEFVALMDHDDLIPEHALFEIVAALNLNRDFDLIYSDEDHIDETGRRNTPHFKTDYNPDLMLSYNAISHLGVYRRSLVETLGGLRVGYEGSQDYDLALRVMDATTPDRILHVPAVLYHWRQASENQTFSEAFLQKCLSSARKALSDHLVRKGQVGAAMPHPLVPIWHRVKRTLPEVTPLVSVIVPTRDMAQVLQICIDGILNRTNYPNLELIIVDHQSVEAEAKSLFESLASDRRVRILSYEGPFNYAAINNSAVRQARGELIALLNNDIDVIDGDWLAEMVSIAVLPPVGVVGAKLLYPHDRVQHGGIVLGPGGVAGHLFHSFERSALGYMGRLAVASTVSAVTGACMVMRKDIFEQVLGFDMKNLAVAFNDVDLCLKIGQQGFRNVWTPFAELYHHESLSRGSDQTPGNIARFEREWSFMRQKWGNLLDIDPFYNPNLNIVSADFSLSFPPRRRPSWLNLDVN